MKKNYLALVFALALPLAAAAQVPDLETSANTDVRAVQLELRMNASDLRGNASTTRALIEQKRADMDLRRETMRAQAEAKRAEVKAKVETRQVELKEEVVEKKLGNTARVMSATIERLENIASRISSRIEKIKARGGETADAERYLAEAKSNIGSAKLSVAALASVELSGETIKEDFERIRSVASEVREYLRSAHENLMLSVRALNSSEVKVETSTSTPTSAQ